MSISMVVQALVIDARRTPDWDAARAAADAYTPQRDDDLNYFDDPHETLHEALVVVEQALSDGDHSAEIAALTVRGAIVYVTGGMSPGHSPTVTFEEISRIPQRVLEAAGFEF